MNTNPDGATLADAVAARHAEINRAFASLERSELLAGSLLPGWDRLTIACHLRYGANASHRMTEDALAGRATSFYPLGRNLQRAATLAPSDDETPAGVIASLDQESRRLDELWASVGAGDWQLAVDEPDDNRDLGPITLWILAILRLTEVEVHGYDLDLGLSPWSETFVSAALPMRLGWLPTRRSNHRSVDGSIDGRWALVRTDGTSFVIEASGDRVDVQEHTSVPSVDATIVGTGELLLRFILGRAPLSTLEVRGDQRLAAAFLDAFPAP